VSAKNIGGHRVAREAPGVVPVYRIDDLGLDVCDLIVLDIEGYELEALTGARETLAQHRPVVMLEDLGHIDKHGFGTTASLYTFLAEHGYRKVAAVAHDVVFTC
jgi:hypothetical protein